MTTKKRVIFLKSIFPNTASQFYANALAELDIDYVEIPFNPHEDQKIRKFGDADLLLLVDCGLPVKFPGLEEFSGPKAYVSIDSCHKLAIHQKYITENNFDFVWVAQKHIVSELGENAQWLPLAADPRTHVFRPSLIGANKPLSSFFRKGYFDVGMCGAPYKHRREMKRACKQTGFSTNFHFRKKFGAEVTAEMAKCTVALNVSAGYTGQKGKDLNMRVFETMANGLCMLLTDKYNGLGYEDLFEEGKHYVSYASAEEMLDKLRFYIDRPEAAIKIAQEAQRLILCSHTYESRCKKILEVI